MPLTGSLYSLDEKDIIRSADGHLIAKDKTVNDTLKFIAIGTGAGLIIGKLMDKNLITSGIIGAVAGYIYSATNKDQVITMDVTVKEGTAFGVRLDHELLFTTSRTFITAPRRISKLQRRLPRLSKQINGFSTFSPQGISRRYRVRLVVRGN